MCKWNCYLNWSSWLAYEKDILGPVNMIFIRFVAFFCLKLQHNKNSKDAEVDNG